MDYVSLYDIKPGERAAVQQLLTTGPMRRRLLVLGLVHGTRIECVGQSPSGDPKAYLIRGAAIALRSEDARNILIRQEVV